MFMLMVYIVMLFGAMGSSCDRLNSAEKEIEQVNAQQDQYLISQPIPAFDWSLERHLVIELYKIHNRKVATHTVWRSDYGMVEVDYNTNRVIRSGAATVIIPVK
jgi:hypothetical protein